MRAIHLKKLFWDTIKYCPKCGNKLSLETVKIETKGRKHVTQPPSNQELTDKLP